MECPLFFSKDIHYLDFSSTCHIVLPQTCSGSKLCSLAKIVFWTWTLVLNCSAKLAHGILSGKYAVPSKKVLRLCDDFLLFIRSELSVLPVLEM